jgi:hypothetical protein
MNKAEVVFEKIALSAKFIKAVEKKSTKVVKRLTGVNYKPRSFEEFRKIQDHWYRKMDQLSFFNRAVKKLKG